MQREYWVQYVNPETRSTTTKYHWHLDAMLEQVRDVHDSNTAWSPAEIHVGGVMVYSLSGETYVDIEEFLATYE